MTELFLALKRQIYTCTGTGMATLCIICI